MEGDTSQESKGDKKVTGKKNNKNQGNDVNVNLELIDKDEDAMITSAMEQDEKEKLLDLEGFMVREKTCDKHECVRGHLLPGLLNLGNTCFANSVL